MQSNVLLVRENVENHAERIESRCRHLCDAHRRAALHWRLIYYLLGGVSFGLALIMSLTAFDALFGGSSTVIKVLSIIVVVSTSMVIFLNPKEMSQAHHLAAIKYDALKNNARKLRNVDAWGASSPEELSTKLAGLIVRKEEIDGNSPQVKPLSVKAMNAMKRVRNVLYGSRGRKKRSTR